MILIINLSYITILKYVAYLLGGLLSVSIVYVLYYFLSKSMLLIGKSKSIFFEKSENEKLSAFELKNKYTSRLSRLIYKITDRYGNLLNISKLEKDIHRANVKGINTITDLVKRSILYAFILGFTLYATRLLLYSMNVNLEMGILVILNIVAVLGGLYLPYLDIQQKVKKQEKNIRMEIPVVGDLLRQGIAAGLLFIDALKEARPKNGGSLDILMMEAIAKIQTSGNHIEAIYDMADKINDIKIKEFLQQLVIAYDADRDRQLEICANLAQNVRELEEISKDLQEEDVDSFLNFMQISALVTFGAVFLALVLYDTYQTFKVL